MHSVFFYSDHTVIDLLGFDSEEQHSCDELDKRCENQPEKVYYIQKTTILYRPGQPNQDFFKTAIFMIYKCYNDMLLLYRYVKKFRIPYPHSMTSEYIFVMLL